ncbi:DMT family transporter [Bacillus sp. CLL-7-23]|uniref:DMT family transporter n=2 Tax=Bacillus changyiensis TaxID=3004103 RepID=A0ABT4X2U9_9BACI|nr:DMT family transporter [Bacillus changyiensis]MDA7026606.1 DMT family transporter [Bacillus changyiensis]
MVTIGAAFWGLSGTVAQNLFQENNMSMAWLVTVRLLVSGILLITLGFFGSEKTKIFTVWKHKKYRVKLIVFGILGMLGVQYTYFASIDEGNAAIATLLQYLAPAFIVFYGLLRYKSLPTFIDFISIFLALTGTFLLLTNGKIDGLTVSGSSIFWGVLSGLSLAFYILYSAPLIKVLGSKIVVGWGMIIGGIGISFFTPPWKVDMGNWTLSTITQTVFVIVFGTLLAFYLYIESLRYISPKETSLLGCTEPVAAVLSSLIWLEVSFGWYQGLGALLILLMIIFMSQKSEDDVKNTNHLEKGAGH